MQGIVAQCGTLHSDVAVVALLVPCRPCNMLAYLRDGAAQTSVSAATPETEVADHCILTQGQPVPGLTL